MNRRPQKCIGRGTRGKSQVIYAPIVDLEIRPRLFFRHSFLFPSFLKETVRSLTQDHRPLIQRVYSSESFTPAGVNIWAVLFHVSGGKPTLTITSGLRSPRHHSTCSTRFDQETFLVTLTRSSHELFFRETRQRTTRVDPVRISAEAQPPAKGTGVERP